MNHHRRPRWHCRSGFNLIEVSLALAICSIGLITLIGLLPTGIDASRQAADDTLAAAIASDVLHWRRISPYTNSTYFPKGCTPLNTHPGTNFTMTLDAMGNLLTNVDLSVNPFYTGNRFLVTYQVMDQPQFPGALDVARVVVTVLWPCTNMVGPGLVRPNATARYFVSDFGRMQ